MDKSKTKSLCVICGVNIATTKDHIPPKGIFPSPKPNDLITVPACGDCNNAVSGLDEKFRVYLSLHVGVDSSGTKNLWEQHALKTLRHNRKLLNTLIKKMEPVHLTTRGGIIIGEGHRALWDSQAHDSIVERMARGLYFHHFKTILGKTAKAKVYWFKELTDDIHKMTNEWSQNSVGGDQFIYRFTRATDQPLCSIWIFQFHKRHWAGSFIEPVSIYRFQSLRDKWAHS